MTSLSDDCAFDMENEINFFLPKLALDKVFYCSNRKRDVKLFNFLKTNQSSLSNEHHSFLKFQVGKQILFLGGRPHSFSSKTLQKFFLHPFGRPERSKMTAKMLSGSVRTI